MTAFEEKSLIDYILECLCGCLSDSAANEAEVAAQPLDARDGVFPEYNQNYFDLREECVRNGQLFEDPCFCLNTDDPTVALLRPGQIVSDPRFKVTSFSRFDIKQGCTNNCWFVVAVANLTQRPANFERVVPLDNTDFDSTEYAGIFRFRFWQYDQWVEVVIDDRLPTIRDANGNIQLLYSRSSEPNEFWSSLLEKAYAKLYGGYHIFDSGKTAEAMQDFTGGVTEIFILKKVDGDFFDLLHRRFLKNTLMVTELDSPHQAIGHAYSISDVRMEKSADSEECHQLIRLRNPWGGESPTRWENYEPEAHKLPPEFLEALKISDYDADGEFWMTYADFKRYLQRVQFCNVNLLSFHDSNQANWQTLFREGSWTADNPAGDQQAAIARNPQFHISLSNPDDGDKCTVVIALVQKNRRMDALPMLVIKFYIYAGTEVTADSESYEEFTSFINIREVAEKFTLPPGEYTIVPCRYYPGDGEFLIRMFSKSTLNII